MQLEARVTKGVAANSMPKTVRLRREWPGVGWTGSAARLGVPRALPGPAARPSGSGSSGWGARRGRAGAATSAWSAHRRGRHGSRSPTRWLGDRGAFTPARSGGAAGARSWRPQPDASGGARTSTARGGWRFLRRRRAAVAVIATGGRADARRPRFAGSASLAPVAEPPGGTALRRPARERLLPPGLAPALARRDARPAGRRRARAEPATGAGANLALMDAARSRTRRLTTTSAPRRPLLRLRPR